MVRAVLSVPCNTKQAHRQKGTRQEGKRKNLCTKCAVEVGWSPVQDLERFAQGPSLGIVEWICTAGNLRVCLFSLTVRVCSPPQVHTGSSHWLSLIVPQNHNLTLLKQKFSIRGVLLSVIPIQLKEKNSNNNKNKIKRIKILLLNHIFPLLLLTMQNPKLLCPGFSLVTVLLEQPVRWSKHPL